MDDLVKKRPIGEAAAFREARRATERMSRKSKQIKSAARARFNHSRKSLRALNDLFAVGFDNLDSVVIGDIRANVEDLTQRVHEMNAYFNAFQTLEGEP